MIQKFIFEGKDCDMGRSQFVQEMGVKGFFGKMKNINNHSIKSKYSNML